MKYDYRAKDRGGQLVTGEFDVENEAEARQRIRAQGLFLLSLAPRGLVLPGIKQSKPLVWRRGVKRAELVTVMSQLTIMCQSGVDLAEAIGNLAEECRAGTLKEVLQKVHGSVSAGSSLSEALRAHPQVFDTAFVAGIAAGEQSGDIVRVLERLTQLLRNDMRLVNSLWSLLTYPMLLCGVTGVVLAAIVFFVLPQFAQVFASLNAPAPPLTRFLLALGDFARGHVLLLGGAAAIAVATIAWLRTTAYARRLWDYGVLHIVIVRNAYRALVTGRIFRLLGTMLQSGVPLLDGVRLCQAAVANAAFRDLFQAVEQELLRGQGMSKPMQEARFLPSGAAQMIATAEKSGKLGQVLLSVGEYFEDEGENHLRDLIKVLEPAIIVALGGVVATVVMSVMLPLFDASTMAH
jgi:type II secretory pathway component PulF